MKAIPLSVALVAAAVAGCAGRGSVYSGRSGPEAVTALYARIDTHGSTPAAVIRSLGDPVRTTSDPTPNAHGYGTDTVITLAHATWRHTFLRLGASGDVLLTGVETTDASTSFPAGIRIGEATGSLLRNRLGTPEHEEATADTTVLAWRNPAMEAESVVELALVRDTLRLVRWVPYVD